MVAYSQKTVATHEATAIAVAYSGDNKLTKTTLRAEGCGLGRQGECIKRNCRDKGEESARNISWPRGMRDVQRRKG